MENAHFIKANPLLTPAEQKQLDSGIDQVITTSRNSRQEISLLVFECATILTEEDDNFSLSASKAVLSSIVSKIAGNNKKLQNKMNNSLQVAQYACQLTLEKLAGQNLMTFDLITAIMNKLNASILSDNEQLRIQVTALVKFFQKQRSNIVNQEMKSSHLAQNMSILQWQNAIEYLQFNDMEYNALNDTAKIVCLVRDFYDLTKGNWTTSDLLLFKTAMDRVNLSPYKKINYFDVIKNIADSKMLYEKLLGSHKISPISEPSHLIMIAALAKMNSLENKDRYYTLTMLKTLKEAGVDSNEKMIRDTLVKNYMREKASVNLDSDVDSYDLALDFLYNLNQAEKEHILVPSVVNIVSTFLQNPQSAFQKVKSAADQGSGMASYLLGNYFEEGYNTVKVDPKKAAKYYEQSFKAGYAPSGIELSTDEDNEDKINALINRSKDETIKLAQNGDCFAQCHLGDMYADGRGVEQSDQEAVKWFRKAAEQGLADAQWMLGMMYADGCGVEQSDEEATKWYRKAAEQGFADAQCDLGDMYAFGRGVEQSDQEAVKWFRKAAEQGLVYAQCDLGRRYADGNGVEQSDQEAVKWLRKAAEQGLADAQWRLGYMYDVGRGVEQSDQEAVKWFRKAAEQGLADAQWRLGMMYADGQGVEQSEEEAVKWLRKAAEQGLVYAQCDLGDMYADGRGVEQSDQEAAKWLRKAAAQGDNNAKEALADLGY